MPTIYFSKEHEGLVKELTKDINAVLPPVFPRYRDLMIFAAMVGKQYDKKEDRVGNGGEVESNYIAGEGFNKDGVVYLLGLLEYDKPEVLKDGAKDCWKLFERYCAGGMDIIEGWLSGSSTIEEYPKILNSKILEVAQETKSKPVIVHKPRKKLSV